MPLVSNIPFDQNRYFTGREGILADLHVAFTSKVMLPQVISGLGGIGKTQTALEYAYRYQQDYRYIFWVRADTPDLLNSDFIIIAGLLELATKDIQDQTLTIAAVKHWLQTHTGWLLVLDNADDSQAVLNFLPAKLQGHVLLTTRQPARGTQIQNHELQEMKPEEGCLFLLRRAKIILPDAPFDAIASSDLEKTGRIVSMMGGLPLALTQAGAYIETVQCGLAGYMERYQLRRSKLLQERRGLTSEHPAPVAETWSLSFEMVEQSNPAAAELLRLCAFLHPDAIPEELITGGAAEIGPVLQPVASDIMELDDTIAVLLNYSLIRRNLDRNTLTIHRLVQDVLKDSLDLDTQRQWAERIVRTVNLVFPQVTFDTWQKCQRLLPHAQTCATLIEQWHFTFSETAQLLTKTGYYLRERAQYAEAEPILVQALDIYKQTQRDDSFDAAHTLNELAELYRLRGKYAQAEQYHHEALAIREHLPPALQADLARTLNNFGKLYQDRAHYSWAEPLYQRAYAIREQILGQEHPDVAESLNNLASLYQAQGKYTDAEPLYQRALSIDEQGLGARHPDTASSLSNLASLYQDQGKYTDAEPLYQRALSIREQELGARHPDTANSLNNLAMLYQAQGKYIQAEPRLKRARNICEQTLGPKHPTTATTIANLAGLYHAKNDYAHAEPLYRQGLMICEQALGTSHPTTMKILTNYIAFLWQAKKKTKAAEMQAHMDAALKKQQEDNSAQEKEASQDPDDEEPDV